MCNVSSDGSLFCSDMGCHIDGFIAVVAHTHVIQEGPVTGRAADVIAAANTAAEVALRLVRPGKKVTIFKHEISIKLTIFRIWNLYCSISIIKPKLFFLITCF